MDRNKHAETILIKQLETKYKNALHLSCYRKHGCTEVSS